jgi:hypothetical protein
LGADDQTSQPALEHGGKKRTTVDLVRSFDEIKEPEIRSALVGLIRVLGRSTAD